MNSIEWTRHELRLLDQRLLPHESVWVHCDSAQTVAAAIEQMVVRGAPAIAAAAAYGLALEAVRTQGWQRDAFQSNLQTCAQRLLVSRPTAVNLRWALLRMTDVVATQLETGASNTACANAMTAAAEQIAAEDVATNQRIGRHGAALFRADRPVRVLTHCNTGALATAGYGTALGVIRRLHAQQRLESVWVDETRPYLQGARLTAYELAAEDIPYRLITDSTAAYVMQQGFVDAVIVGADRIARNGDTANKIGTYGLAVLCQYHQIPFYVAAPLSTFDLELESGQQIPIEQRSEAEVTVIGGQSIAPSGARALHAAFDVTGHDLITAIITEHGVITHPNADTVGALQESIQTGQGGLQ